MIQYYDFDDNFDFDDTNVLEDNCFSMIQKTRQWSIHIETAKDPITCDLFWLTYTHTLFVMPYR